MHACGHDLHTAMLLGAAHLLADARDRIAGSAVLAFQPGEEGYDGAGRMLDEGLLDVTGSRPEVAYALHVTSASIPSGVLAGRPGPMMAAMDPLEVTIRGRGGHGSAPHRAADPIQAAAAMVTALQVAVTRHFDVFDPVVVTVGLLSGGTAHNILPETARFEATLRSFSPASRDRLAELLPTVCRSVAVAHGVEVDVIVHALFPPTINDRSAVDRALALGRESLGPDRVQVLEHP